MTTSQWHEHHGRAMGASLHLLVDGPADLVEGAVRRIGELEACWSRFRDDSELTRLNRQPGRPVTVSADLRQLLEVMLVARALTGGLYDPTLLRRLVALGYDHSREDGRRAPDLGPSVASTGVPTVPPLQLHGDVAHLAQGVALDPGGIGKGLAADLVVTELLAAGAQAALVNLGGDLRAAGPGPQGLWHVVVEAPPPGAALVTTLSFAAGAVATSSTRTRRWHGPTGEVHHALDPRTGEPADTDLANVTVVAASAAWAEALATAALVLGTTDAYRLLTANGVDGVLQPLDGPALLTPDLALRGAAPSWAPPVAVGVTS